MNPIKFIFTGNYFVELHCSYAYDPIFHRGHVQLKMIIIVKTCRNEKT